MFDQQQHYRILIHTLCKYLKVHRFRLLELAGLARLLAYQNTSNAVFCIGWWCARLARLNHYKFSCGYRWWTRQIQHTHRTSVRIRNRSVIWRISNQPTLNVQHDFSDLRLFSPIFSTSTPIYATTRYSSQFFARIAGAMCNCYVKYTQFSLTLTVAKLCWPNSGLVRLFGFTEWSLGIQNLVSRLVM